MSCVRRVGIAALAVAASLLGAAAVAQQVYRIVGPDGRVTFSDKPPTDGTRARPAPAIVLPSAGAGGTALPFELRSVAARYPVTLYTGQDCPPCVQARNFLVARGVPFSERTVTTDDDIEALKRLAGAARLPFLTIGGQQIRGFAEAELGQYLDAAGYPRTSQLPSSYRQPPPAPLVAVQQAPSRQAGAPQEAQPPAAVQAPEEPAPSNPAGIRF